MSAQTLTLVVDKAAAADVVAQVQQAQDLLQTAPQWLQWLATLAFEHLQERLELLRLDSDNAAAAATGELLLRPDLAREFVLLVAALRAGQGDGEAWVQLEIEASGHEVPRA
jgi:hypothetical protein